MRGEVVGAVGSVWALSCSLGLVLLSSKVYWDVRVWECEGETV